MKEIYEYLDYREYLKDVFAYNKENNPNFSYRYFNMKAGLKSSGHIKLIMDGQLNMGKKSLYGICKGLGFSEKESRFFEQLVNFNQAKSHEEKDHHYNNLIRHYPPKHPNMIAPQFYKLFNHWYYVAILELIRHKDFNEDPKWISEKLKPTVIVPKVKEALLDLEEFGLISRDENGKLVRTDTMISTPDEVASLAVIKYNAQTSQLAFNSLKKDPVDEKEFSTLTVAVSKKDFEKVKKKIQDFRDELHTMLESSDNDKTDVAVINFQLFKLTRD